MSLFAKTKKNLYFISLLSLVDKIASFVLVVCMARYLGAETYGLYVFAFAITNIMAIFADWGINALLTRDLSADLKDKEKTIAIALGIKIPATLFSLIIIFSIAQLTPSLQGNSMVMLLVALSHLLRMLSMTLQTIFRATLEMQYEAYAGIINRVLAVGLGAVALIFGHGLIVVLWIFVFASVIEFLYTFILLKNKHIPITIKLNLSEQKAMILTAFPFLMLLSFATVNYKFDTILLGFIDTKEAIGIYNAAYALILNFLAVQQIAGRVLLPVFTKLVKEQKTTFEKYTKETIKLLLVLALFAILVVEGFGKEIILLIYGDGFIQSVKCFKILIFAVAFMLSSHILSTALLAIKKEKLVAKSWITTIILNIVLNTILIPKFSYIGASIATVVSEMVLFAMNYYHLVFSNRYSFFQAKDWIKLSIPFFAGLTFLSMSSDLSIFMTAPLLLVIYGLGLIFSKAFSKEEINRLVRLIRP